MLYSAISTIWLSCTTYFCVHSFLNGCPVARTVPDSFPKKLTDATAYRVEAPMSILSVAVGHLDEGCADLRAAAQQKDDYRRS